MMRAPVCYYYHYILTTIQGKKYGQKYIYITYTDPATDIFQVMPALRYHERT